MSGVWRGKNENLKTYPLISLEGMGIWDSEAPWNKKNAPGFSLASQVLLPSLEAFITSGLDCLLRL